MWVGVVWYVRSVDVGTVIRHCAVSRAVTHHIPSTLMPVNPTPGSVLL